MKTINLKNGIKLIIEPMPNTHSITIGLYVRAGTRYEDQDNGITHLLEHIHFRELNNMSQNELYYNMESMGSTLRAATFYDLLKFSMKIRPVYLQKCVSVFKGILSTYNWTEENYNKEKEVVKNQIEEADFTFSEETTIRQILFGNSPFANSIMGNKEGVDSIQLSDLIAYKKRVFNKNNLLICVTGCVDGYDIKTIENQFSMLITLEGDKNIPNEICPLLYHRKPNIVLKQDEWEFIDVTISFDVDYRQCSIDELKILNCILGEGVGSRLQKCVREELNLTSNIFSETEIYEDFALLHIKFSVQKKRLIDCLFHVFKTVNNLKHNITSADLDISLPFYIENQVFLLDDTEQMNFEIAYNTFVLQNKSSSVSIKNDNKSINHLINVAKKIFVPNNTSVVAFGNFNHITKKSIREIILTLDEG